MSGSRHGPWAGARHALDAFVRRGWAYLCVPAAAYAVYLWFLLDATQGRLCPQLDDAFIHYQYARSIAEGHPLAYHPGELPTTGATSFGYVALVAVGWAVGFRGMATTLFAHLLAVVGLALGGWAAKRMGDRLLGAPAGAACAGCVWAFPQLVFMAFGGMEVALVVAAQLLAVGAAVRWSLSPAGRRTPRRALGVALLGALAALSRPEALSGAAAVALALAALGSGKPWTRAYGAIALAPGALPGLVARWATGQGRTNGQIVKWLFADPYVDPETAIQRTRENVVALVDELLTGTHGDHAVPLFFSYLVLLGAALTVGAVVRRHGARGLVASLCFLGGAGGILVPATYWTFDTNLGRYLWPFVPLWAMAGAMGAVVIGRALARRTRLRGAPVALAAGFVALCVAHPKRSLERFVDSASEICGQHLRMVAHLEREVPDDAVLAVNDAGAFAYLTDLQTYDLVGLTTTGAAPAWANGQGSVFEQLERVPTHRRPSYIAYYPTWLGKLRIMGERLARVRLDDASHVGGDVIELRRIRTALFGSGAHPVIVTPRGQPVDTLDVADVVSERDHEYALRFAVRHENWTEVAPAPDGHPVADGGRLQRTLERFVLAGRPGSPATWVFRTDRRNDCRVELTFNGEPLTPVDVTRGDGWAEHETAIDAHLVRSHNVLTRRCLGDAGVGVYHDWLYQ